MISASKRLNAHKIILDPSSISNRHCRVAASASALAEQGGGRLVHQHALGKPRNQIEDG
jgi:hypothetical protein